MMKDYLELADFGDFYYNVKKDGKMVMNLYVSYKLNLFRVNIKAGKKEFDFNGDRDDFENFKNLEKEVKEILIKYLPDPVEFSAKCELKFSNFIISGIQERSKFIEDVLSTIDSFITIRAKIKAGV